MTQEGILKKKYFFLFLQAKLKTEQMKTQIITSKALRRREKIHLLGNCYLELYEFVIGNRSLLLFIRSISHSNSSDLISGSAERERKRGNIMLIYIDQRILWDASSSPHPQREKIQFVISSGTESRFCSFRVNIPVSAKKDKTVFSTKTPKFSHS